LENEELPPVTVVISTRNRGDSIVPTIESIIKCDYPAFEIRVIDQSENDQTEIAVGPFMANPAFHYLRTPTIGASLGRNLGINSTQYEYIAITDDDCVVPSNWLREMMAAFKVNSQIGLVFGNVDAGEHDPTAGHIPTYFRNVPYMACSMRHKNEVRGIFACAGLKRSVWEKVYGIDEMLGPGSPLKCFEDGDFTIKTLCAGYFVYEIPTFKIIHNGFRDWKQGRALAHRNWYGIGAGLAKHLKCGQWSILRVIGYEWGNIAIRDMLNNIFIKHRLSGVTPVIAFGGGFFAGLFTPVDRNTANYLSKDGSGVPTMESVRF